MPTNPILSTCLKQEPLIALGEGNAPKLNYQLPVKSVFESRAVITIPLLLERLKEEYVRPKTRTVWDVIRDLSLEEIQGEVIHVLRGNRSRFGIILNTYLLQGMSIIEPFEAEKLKREQVLGDYPPPRFKNKEAYEEWMKTQQSPRPRAGYTTVSGMPISDAFFNPFEIANHIKGGGLAIVIKTPSGILDLEYKYEPKRIIPRLYLVQHLKVASYARDYGATKTIGTFSLLPGERTTISLRSYTKKEQTKVKAENILDSFSHNSASSFQQHLQNAAQTGVSQESSEANEMIVNTNQNAQVGSSSGSTSASFNNYSGSFDVGGGVGMGFPIAPNLFLGVSYQVSAGGSLGGGTSQSGYSGHLENYTSGLVSQSANQSTLSSALQSVVSTLNDAIESAVTESSSYRQVEINTTTTESYTEEHETATIRQLENINYSRVLNFVFRQLCQQYLTITYLHDVTFVYTDGTPESRVVLKLSELSQFLNQLYQDSSHADQLFQNIMLELCNVRDYQGAPQPFVQCTNLELALCCEEGETVLQHVVQKNPDLVQTVDGIRIKGVVLDVSERVLPVDHVICEALLGQGEALDCYNSRLQEAAVQKAEQELQARQIELDMRNLELQNRNAELQLELQEREMSLTERQTEVDIKAQAMAILDLITDPEQKAELYKKVFGTCCGTAQTQIIP